jgi:hypothetical protein
MNTLGGSVARLFSSPGECRLGARFGRGIRRLYGGEWVRAACGLLSGTYNPPVNSTSVWPYLIGCKLLRPLRIAPAGSI